MWRKIVENLLIFVYLFDPKNGAIDFTKTFITRERLYVKSFPIPRWIAFLMLYPLVYNICTHFNELILAWSAYLYWLIFYWKSHFTMADTYFNKTVRLCNNHIVRLAIWHQLFLEFRLVNAWFLAHPCDQRPVTRHQNVCQLNKRLGKKLVF